MKKIILSILLGVSSLFASAQSENKIVIGTIDSIHSKILGEQRKIWIYVPNSGPEGIYSKQRYPVVYLLDGDAHFYSVVGMIQQLSQVNGNTICPEMIVVGIPNTDRTRDLTPTHIVSDPPFMDSAFSKNSGGGEKFISFIEKELFPHIDSIYPTQPYRMLIGHSFGGLTVMNTFTHHTKLFNAYVSIDPSMWWDNKKLLIETKNALSTKNFKGTSLFLGIANTMPDGMDTLKAISDTTLDTKQIHSILELSSYLNDNKQNALKSRTKYYNDDDHGSVPLIAEYDALRFIFDYYPLKLSMQEYMNMNKEVISKMEKHYKVVSEHLGYQVKLPENMINGLGYQKLAEKNFDMAEYLFKLNTENYPLSANTFDSLGDLYDAKGDKKNAIASYKKAMSIKVMPETKMKLEKLEKK
jgi:predicted alpha/beta superfamily hydrolase